MNKLNEMAMDGSDTLLHKTAFYSKRLKLRSDTVMLYLHKPLHVRRCFKFGSLKLKNNNSSLYNMELMNFV